MVKLSEPLRKALNDLRSKAEGKKLEPSADHEVWTAIVTLANIIQALADEDKASTS